MSAFVVLRREQLDPPRSAAADNSKNFTLLGEFDAVTGKQAISKAAAKIGAGAHGQTLVAVPMKNWTELTVAVETNPRYSFT